MIPCDFGHAEHAKKSLMMPWGPFVIYDWKQYFGQTGWCPGQDDVSRTLDMYGTWESYDIDRFVKACEPGLTVLDFGSHIGWYTIQAALTGAQVVGFEWDWERRDMCDINAYNAGVEVEIVDPIPEFYAVDGPVVIKSDVEGAEDKVLAATRNLFAQRQVIAAVLEISPEFADYYPALVAEILDYGYRADIAGEPWVGMPAYQQNVWFTL